MNTLEGMIKDLNKSELVADDGETDICTTSGELITALKRLQHYEDLEEQGRLIELPCSVGVTVHVPLGDKVQECKVVRFEIGQYVTIVLEMTMFHITFGVLDRAFGKTVFLSKDAAEAVLKGAEQ